MSHQDDLRAWAKGDQTVEAAVELLLRGFNGRFTKPEWAWMHADEHDGRPTISFEDIPEHLEGLSDGERRLLRLAGSLAGAVPVVLGEALPGLARDQAAIFLAAAAHAAGRDQPPAFSEDDETAPWP